MSTKKNPEPADRLLFEKKAFDEGFGAVAGIDEAGRGPLAGPVVAAAVVVINSDFSERIDDSKKLTERARERAFLEIMDKCDVGIGRAEVEDIDTINILNATLLAMKRAVHDLSRRPDYLLVDGMMDLDLPQERMCLVRGEAHSISIACASIVAKVFRDKLMAEYEREYPVYGFGRHKGYGTKAHIEAIREHGLCPIHRRSFGPCGAQGRRD
ncbi:MAG: ribonuclease HII [Candidatus Omnitrophica bacterium]|nr:ribonuclease HII [Candidatus Omnitrophota bacterium]